jgi:hypothetical protein
LSGNCTESAAYKAISDKAAALASSISTALFTFDLYPGGSLGHTLCSPKADLDE